MKKRPNVSEIAEVSFCKFWHFCVVCCLNRANPIIAYIFPFICLPLYLAINLLGIEKYFCNNNKNRSKRKNNGNYFFPVCSFSYGCMERVFLVVAYFLMIFAIVYIASPVFRVKFFYFGEKIFSRSIIINNQKSYRDRTKYYDKRNLGFTNRHKRCDSDNHSIKSNESVPQ